MFLDFLSPNCTSCTDFSWLLLILRSYSSCLLPSWLDASLPGTVVLYYCSQWSTRPASYIDQCDNCLTHKVVLIPSKISMCPVGTRWPGNTRGIPHQWNVDPPVSHFLFHCDQRVSSRAFTAMTVIYTEEDATVVWQTFKGQWNRCLCIFFSVSHTYFISSS